MQDQGEVLRHLRAEHQARIPADLELRFEAADFAADEIVEANAVPHRIGDRTVGGGHGLQPIHQALLDRRLPDHAFAGQAEADDRLDHGKQILNAMMQLLGQKVLVLLCLLLPIDVDQQDVQRPVDEIDEHDAHGCVKRIGEERNPVERRDEKAPL